MNRHTGWNHPQKINRHPDENRGLVRLCRGLVSGSNVEIPAFAGMTKKGSGMTIQFLRGTIRRYDVSQPTNHQSHTLTTHSYCGIVAIQPYLTVPAFSVWVDVERGFHSAYAPMRVESFGLT